MTLEDEISAWPEDIGPPALNPKNPEEMREEQEEQQV
jgi:hypothetical protein